MFNGSNRMIPHHARTFITHGFTHLFLHVRLVAMDRTLLASRFVFSEFAMIQTLIGIVKLRVILNLRNYENRLFLMICAIMVTA
mgnify:CR=1 FL=1|jgi:hypothetical protein